MLQNLTATADMGVVRDVERQTGLGFGRNTEGVRMGSSNSDQKEIIQNELDREAFLKLLITQLRHQDPLKPMEDKEFIAQMAQFSSLEQMQLMNKNLESVLESQKITDAASLIGRNIETTEDGQKIKGKVIEVVQEDSEIFVKVEDAEGEIEKINFNNIRSIT